LSLLQSDILFMFYFHPGLYLFPSDQCLPDSIWVGWRYWVRTCPLCYSCGATRALC